MLVEFGETRVICTASVEERVPPFLKGRARAGSRPSTACCRAPRTPARRARRRGAQSGRTQEIQRLIGRSLRACADLAALGERTITIDCDVIQADGGTRTAAITGGFVALADAVRTLLERRSLKKNPLHRPDRQRLRSASGAARRCSTSTTPRIPRPKPT